MNPTAVAVFGSSEPPEGSPLYEIARQMGRLLAGAGHAVVTGGYGGVMEAASRGARDGGGHTVGVLCAIFSSRQGNPYLVEAETTADLFERTRSLVRRSAAFVVLDGKAGTLAELSFLWALHRAGCLDGRPVVLLGNSWNSYVDDLVRDGRLDEAEARVTHIAGSPHEVMKILADRLEIHGER